MKTKIRIVTLLEVPGKCRWCGCTEARACGSGCSWANRAATLCSECVPIDTMIRSAAGRAELAVLAADATRERERQEAAIAAAAALARKRKRARRRRAAGRKR